MLEERGYRLSWVAGTSGGAIVGALVAAGMPTEEMATIMEEPDYRRFQDARGLTRLPGGKTLALLTSHGVYHGDYLTEWLAERLAAHEVHTFAQLRGNDPERSLPAERDYRLAVIVSDITQGALRRLPWDYNKYGCETDDMAVADAVRASVSIPFFYRPVKLKDRRSGRRCWLLDGGMLSNFRWLVSTAAMGNAPLAEVGSQAVGSSGRWRLGVQCAGVVSTTRAMAGTMMGFYGRLHLDAEDVMSRTIFVDTHGARARDFNLDKATQRRLFNNGRKAAQKS